MYTPSADLDDAVADPSPSSTGAQCELSRTPLPMTIRPRFSMCGRQNVRVFAADDITRPQPQTSAHPGCQPCPDRGDLLEEPRSLMRLPPLSCLDREGATAEPASRCRFLTPAVALGGCVAQQPIVEGFEPTDDRLPLISAFDQRATLLPKRTASSRSFESFSTASANACGSSAISRCSPVR